MGNLTDNPELRITDSGKSVTNFRIGVSRKYVKNGEARKADFFDVVCWGQRAEFVCQYFKKGSRIALDGRLETREYETRDGLKRRVVEIIAEDVSFTSNKRNIEDNQNQN